MAQFGRPSADTTLDTWTDQAGGTTSIFATIDEVSPSDADFIKTPAAPTNDVYVAPFADVVLEDPVSSAGHIVRYRYQKDVAAGAQINLTVELRQGYVSEGTPGTLIHSESVPNIANGFTTGSFTLSGIEADAITDYTSLFVRIVANQV